MGKMLDSNTIAALNAASKMAYDIAKSKGFYPATSGEMIKKLIEEVDEVAVEIRNFLNGEDHALGEEAADVVITMFAAAYFLLGEGVGQDISDKLKKNAGRPWRHGKG